MKTDIQYSIRLKQNFEAAYTVPSDSIVSATASKPISEFQQASGDYFMKERMFPIETFVARMAGLAPDRAISSHRLIEMGEVPSKALCVCLGEQQFWIKNFVSGSRWTASSAHEDNKAFLVNVSESIGAFSAALGSMKPEIRSEISHELRLLENRLRQNCHAIVARMKRRDKARGYRESDQSAVILPFEKPEIS